MTEAKAVFCPTCGAASVDRRPLAGRASCRVCDWHGGEHELAAMPFAHGLGDDEGILRALFLDLRNTLGQKLAQEMALFLVRWGFLGATEPKVLARYLAVSARAMVQAILLERERIEKEKHGRS